MDFTSRYDIPLTLLVGNPVARDLLLVQSIVSFKMSKTFELQFSGVLERWSPLFGVYELLLTLLGSTAVASGFFERRKSKSKWPSIFSSDASLTTLSSKGAHRSTRGRRRAIILYAHWWAR